MAFSLEDLDRMHVEWEAWQVVCRELTRLKLDINKEDRLHAAIVRWGEELVQLRLQQEDSVIASALQQKRDLARKTLP